jgi:phosphoglucomutase
MMTSRERYKRWLENDYFDEETKKELADLEDNQAEIEDRFYKDLEFGTAGLRGILGAGTNRMNRYVIRKATHGLALYLVNNVRNAKGRGVVIAYDSRRMSSEFAMETARVLAYNGIRAFVFETLRPVPVLSFAVRHLSAAAGVVITASHNTKEYNGYKVYGEDGAQLTPECSRMITDQIAKIKNIESIGIMDREEAFAGGLVQFIGAGIDDAYIEYLKTLRINPELQKAAAGLKLVYTPLHGSGNVPVRRILAETGFSNLIVVKEQEMPDPEFPTVKYPNPEEKSSFELAIEIAEKENADLIIGTDPDCDRVGVAVKNGNNEYEVLTGNQVGCLLLEYILSNRLKKGTLPENGFAVTTIVSTRLTESIAEFYGIKLVKVLTGFKYIGEKIREMDEMGDQQFLFGFEESYGYLAGNRVRDKDAVVTSMLIAEMFLYHKTRGLTPYDALLELFEKYGYYLEGVESFYLEGKEGEDKIKAAMSWLRMNKPSGIGGRTVLAFKDYLEGTELPASDVLYFELPEKEWFCIRPSGTEPKIKIYFGTRGNSIEDAKMKLESLKTDALGLIKPLFCL